MTRPIRLLALLAILVGVLTAAGCGQDSTHSQKGTVTDEGEYLELGGLKYQIQISRYLNPADSEDSAYLRGLPSGVKLGTDDIWFAVFMRVENDGSKPEPSTADYEITDTQHNTFRPVPLNPKVNDFAYQATTLQPSAIVPSTNTIAGQGVIQGSLVLFRLKESDLQNRPLTLQISRGGSSGETARVDLDL
jgi:hypothetical protein